MSTIISTFIKPMLLGLVIAVVGISSAHANEQAGDKSGCDYVRDLSENWSPTSPAHFYTARFFYKQMGPYQNAQVPKDAGWFAYLGDLSIAAINWYNPGFAPDLDQRRAIADLMHGYLLNAGATLSTKVSANMAIRWIKSTLEDELTVAQIGIGIAELYDFSQVVKK